MSKFPREHNLSYHFVKCWIWLEVWRSNLYVFWNHLILFWYRVRVDQKSKMYSFELAQSNCLLQTIYTTLKTMGWLESSLYEFGYWWLEFHKQEESAPLMCWLCLEWSVDKSGPQTKWEWKSNLVRKQEFRVLIWICCFHQGWSVEWSMEDNSWYQLQLL